MNSEKPNVLILGGASGGIGRMVLNNLEATGQYNLIGTYNKNKHEQPRFDFCNLCDPESIKKVFDKNKPSVILNFAGMAQEKLCRDNPDETKRTNVEGIQNLVRQAETDKIPLLYASTINTLTGYHNGELCNEDILPLAKPDSIYGQSKIAAENIVKTSSLIWTIPRTDLVLGSDYGIAKLFKDNGYAKIMINAVRFPIYIDDYSRYLQEFIRNPHKHTGIIHLYSEEFRLGYKLADVAEKIITKFKLAESSIVIPNATDEIIVRRTDNIMPIYITPTANDNLPKFFFTSNRH